MLQSTVNKLNITLITEDDNRNLSSSETVELCRGSGILSYSKINSGLETTASFSITNKKTVYSLLKEIKTCFDNEEITEDEYIKDWKSTVNFSVCTSDNKTHCFSRSLHRSCFKTDSWFEFMERISICVNTTFRTNGLLNSNDIYIGKRPDEVILASAFDVNENTPLFCISNDDSIRTGMTVIVENTKQEKVKAYISSVEYIKQDEMQKFGSQLPRILEKCL